VVIDVSDAELETIVVAGKPALRYVTACLTVFNQGRKRILVRARGKSIENCVATVELLRRSFIKDLGVENISIISYIEILLRK